MHAHVVYCRDIPAGIIGATVSIEYTDSMWDGLSKTVVFKGAETRTIANAGNVVTVPAEVVARKNVVLRVGIYGVDAEEKIAIPTLWADLKVVSDATDPSGDPATDPSLPVWAQLQDDVAQLENEVEQLMQNPPGGGGPANVTINGEKPDANGNFIINTVSDVEIAQLSAALT